jgi:eukaryotic-like serine/threonine-protein kinase
MTLERHTLLNNRYRIGDILGQGGMASIYRAIDENLGLEVAVKENLFTTEEYERQFRFEAVILANLRHPNLPRVTDHFVIEGQGQYLVMDYIEGEDLRQRMDRLGVLQEEDVIVIGAAICDALLYLHSLNPAVLHRDIKPGNVKIDPNGNIFLVDFGLAKVMQGSEATTTGARAMTPGYSPPEQYGTARTDHRSDIYSLGATLYSALTDTLPEDGLARAMEQVDLTPVREHNPEVSKRLASVIEKALEVRPDDRFQSVETFRTHLLNARGTGRRKTPVPQVLEPPPPGAYPEGGAPEREPGSEPVLPAERKDKSDLPILPSSFGSYSQRGRRGEHALQRGSSRRRLLASLGTLGLVFLIFGITWINRSPSAVPGGLVGASATHTPSVTSAATRTVEPWTTPNPAAAPAAVFTETPEPTPTHTPSRELPTRPVMPTRTMTPTAVPTPMGGGQAQIAFASDRSGVPEIYLMNLDGTGLQKITDILEGACQPSWSPDGSKIVFTSPCSRTGDNTYPGSSLFMINADATELTPLPTLPGGDFDPVWSPDGKRILFTSIRNNAISQLFILDLATYEVTHLPDPDNRDNFQGTWSPDGTKIAFVGPRNQIWIMNADGSERIIISRPSNYINRNPNWSPDGQSIVFSQFAPETFSWLALGKPEAGSISVILSQDHPMAKASFSPDGFWIVFQGRIEGSSRDLFVMTRNGVGRQRLTNDPANNFDPTWRPGPSP